MKNFGKTVQYYRRQLGWTQEDLCQDEVELSIRQLSRIESGKSNPSLDKVRFIAERLGVSIGELTDDSSPTLPARYKDLKFLILRQPFYLDTEQITQRENYFQEILTDFYDNLPEEEQLIINILHSQLDIIAKDTYSEAKQILLDYFKQIQSKSIYSVNDLILIDLYLTYVHSKHYRSEVFDEAVHHHIVNHIFEQVNHLPTEELFVLNKVLTNLFNHCLAKNCQLSMKKTLVTMEKIMEKNRDFQILPILNQFKWKFSLKLGDYSRARHYFHKAYLCASLIYDHQLLRHLEKEWHTDNPSATS